jgi:hypothetical protein
MAEPVILSEQKPMFKPRPIHVRSKVDKEVIGQVFLQMLQFSCQYRSFVHFGPVGFSSGQLGVIQYFISLTNAQKICFKTLKYKTNIPTCFGFDSTCRSIGYIYLNVNVHVLKQIYCALVGLITDWITSKCTVQLWKLARSGAHI